MSTQAFAAALAAILESGIDQALQPLHARIETLETELAQLRDRLDTGSAQNDPWLKQALAEALADIRVELESAMENAALAAVYEHESQYDHDDFDAHINDDETHVDGDAIHDQVREELRGQISDASISIQW